MSTVVIEADRVDVVRDGNLLLDSVSLTVRSGEHWALLGANGAGKSTLLGLLGAVSHPTRGTVEVLGRELGRVDLRELRTYLGHVNPRHPLRSPLRVRDVVLTGLTNSVEPVPRRATDAEDLNRADRLLGMLGMGGKGDAREQLLSSLDALRREHPELATILVTHHLEELPATTTHAMLLRGGRCLGSGRADEVLTTDRVSECFDHPVRIARTEGRWTARAERVMAPAA
ncbi:ATP-binding cassette domain-containing protein [Streptomyces sp. NPDC002994]|uniref:ATP-binding cassette domain-containing protein n=1 Tax=Streptomyces sp. NPDC002994 TaxID=3154441 RepID=UPI0033A5487C